MKNIHKKQSWEFAFSLKIAHLKEGLWAICKCCCLPKSESLFKKERCEWFVLFLRASCSKNLCPRANCSGRSFAHKKQVIRSKTNEQIPNPRKIWIFLRESLVFWEPFAWITSKLLTLLFFNERKERSAHSPSFVKSEESDSLTDALFSRATRAKSKWAKEQIPNPVSGACTPVLYSTYQTQFAMQFHDNTNFALYVHTLVAKNP